MTRRYGDRLERIAQVVGPREPTEEELARSRAWRELRAVLIAALEPFPEARRAVVERLAAYYEGNRPPRGRR
jgi:hypothetical protein